jgi:hypothetical protein
MRPESNGEIVDPQPAFGNIARLVILAWGSHRACFALRVSLSQFFDPSPKQTGNDELKSS